MNMTSRAILQTVLTTDATLSKPERDAVQRIIDGNVEAAISVASIDDRLLVTQKKAAELLSVSRVTIWRMTKEHQLHPVEVLPGILRYPCSELNALVRHGWRRLVEIEHGSRALTA
jgi:hypothetical protein